MSISRRSVKPFIFAVALVSGMGTLVPTTAISAHASTTEEELSKKLLYTAVGSGVIDVEGGIHNVSANLSGITMAVQVKIGERVKKGQALARQNDLAEQVTLAKEIKKVERLKRQIALGKVRIERAEQELGRLKPLVDNGVMIALEYQRSEDQLFAFKIDNENRLSEIASANDEIELLKFNIEQRIIRSPVNGVIADITAKVGYGSSTENISSLFSIIPDTEKIVHAQIDIGALKDIYQGQNAIVSSKLNSNEFYQAKVDRIARYIELPGKEKDEKEQPSFSQKVKVYLTLVDKDMPLMIGQNVQIRFLKNAS
ncbi:HlyD family secretion protein [Bowmanella pacifica]|uniref:RND efflux pump membrane fusion protein barrel-sandwich domain-containing protein n=1 Tax=Bowmanella pacifica TaxID=502051 RepID=A0A918DLC7_9ALTE|nr:HlyD family efflux transporter periplasmic adaptor subunit [Bowmanella pacifica]GGO71369.1 hypothetical protein GCM10010982_27000 [Bowmanella pacifica]